MRVGREGKCEPEPFTHRLEDSLRRLNHIRAMTITGKYSNRDWR